MRKKSLENYYSIVQSRVEDFREVSLTLPRKSAFIKVQPSSSNDSNKPISHSKSHLQPRGLQRAVSWKVPIR